MKKKGFAAGLAAVLLIMSGITCAAECTTLINSSNVSEASAVTNSGTTEEFGLTQFSVDFEKEIGRLKPFWNSTGFTPAKSLFDGDRRQTIIQIASIPHGGMTYVRPHYLLDLVSVKNFGSPEAEYNWSKLDKILDLFIENGLKPLFEIMGIPVGVGEIRKSEEDPSSDSTEIIEDQPKSRYGLETLAPEQWRILTRDVALHCIDRYGREEVRSWLFETWNEPEGYKEDLWTYYDVCSAGLRDADPELKFGGPGTYKTLDTTFTGLLEHCDKGKNYVTGETGTRMDFISVHEKGTKRSGQFTDASPVLKEWLDREIATIKYIRANHPRFSKTLYINDECDPKGGYWHPYTWYSTAYYPAVIAKYIDHHLRRIVDVFGIDTLVSNDNAYTGDWGVRAHVTRFGKEPSFDLIKRPINAGFVAFSLLGDQRCAVNGPDLFSDLGAIATKTNDGQVAVLVYNCNEVGTRERHEDARWVIEKYGLSKIELNLNNIPFSEATLVHYRLDNEQANPYAVWQKMGSPKAPNADQIAEMRQVQELAMLEEPKNVTVKDGYLKLDFMLPMPGVSLLLLTQKPVEGPGKVEGLRAERYQGSDGGEQVLLIWKELPSKAIRTYEVLYSDTLDGTFKRVNESDFICKTFLYVKDKSGVNGFYKIRAVDYWGRAGAESDILSLP